MRLITPCFWFWFAREDANVFELDQGIIRRYMTPPFLSLALIVWGMLTCLLTVALQHLHCLALLYDEECRVRTHFTPTLPLFSVSFLEKFPNSFVNYRPKGIIRPHISPPALLLWLCWLFANAFLIIATELRHSTSQHPHPLVPLSLLRFVVR
jgi:hypothetical protein